MTFGSVVGTRTPRGHELYRRYWESAVEIPGPSTDRLGEIAARNKIHLVVGVIERRGGTLYCSVAFLGPDGRLLGHHRKLMPTGMERLIWGQGDGSTLPVIATPLNSAYRSKCGPAWMTWEDCWEN